eukprot:scaffold157099_cov32-Tisochrysis_lutea.AAC.2
MLWSEIINTMNIGDTSTRSPIASLLASRARAYQAMRTDALKTSERVKSTCGYNGPSLCG